MHACMHSFYILAISSRTTTALSNTKDLPNERDTSNPRNCIIDEKFPKG